jgi:hypothetical protein
MPMETSLSPLLSTILWARHMPLSNASVILWQNYVQCTSSNPVYWDYTPGYGNALV